MGDTVSSYIMRTPDGGPVEVWIDRQTLPDGRTCCTLIQQGGEILGCWWEKPPSKQRRGSRSRYCFGECWDDLTMYQRDALSGIRQSVLNNGKRRSRKRMKNSRWDELAEAIGSESMLRGLIRVGAIYEKDGWFYVDRRFLFRG